MIVIQIPELTLGIKFVRNKPNDAIVIPINIEGNKSLVKFLVLKRYLERCAENSPMKAKLPTIKTALGTEIIITKIDSIFTVFTFTPSCLAFSSPSSSKVSEREMIKKISNDPIIKQDEISNICHWLLPIEAFTASAPPIV